MSWFRRLIPPPIVLILAGALLAASFLTRAAPDVQLAEVAPEEKSADTNEQSDSTVSLGLPEPKDYETALAEITERPLFSETRRIPSAVPPKPVEIPAEPEPILPLVQEATKPPPPPERVEPPIPPALIFAGFMKAGQKTSALLMLPDQNKELWVTEGDMIDGWEVTRIANTTVTIRREAFKHVVDVQR